MLATPGRAQAKLSPGEPIARARNSGESRGRKTFFSWGSLPVRRLGLGQPFVRAEVTLPRPGPWDLYEEQALKPPGAPPRQDCRVPWRKPLASGRVRPIFPSAGEICDTAIGKLLPSLPLLPRSNETFVRNEVSFRL
jgi:hypothetical protein